VNNIQKYEKIDIYYINVIDRLEKGYIIWYNCFVMNFKLARIISKLENISKYLRIITKKGET